MLAATSHDLDTAPMEGFDSERLAVYLNLPRRYSPAIVVATGHATDEHQQSSRFPAQDVFSEDSFGTPFQGIPTL